MVLCTEKMVSKRSKKSKERQCQLEVYNSGTVSCSFARRSLGN